MNRAKRVKAGMASSIILLMGLATACTSGGGASNASNGGGEAQTSSGTGAAAAQPAEITMMNLYQSVEPPKMDSEAIQLLEKYTNTQLKITWVPKSSYNDKLTASIAAIGDLPEVLMVRDDRNPTIIQAVNAGMFWEVGPYLKDYPNLNSLDKGRFENMSVGGKIYGLYRWRPISRNGLIIRKDWLDKLGLQVPKTTDELVNVFRAFANNDPDGNGKKDTFGFSMSDGMASFANMLSLMGAPNNWGYIDGKMTPSFMTKPFMDTLKLFRQMYQEKLFNSDFPLVKDRATLVNQGKAGAYFGVYDDLPVHFADLAKADPKAELIAIPNVAGPSGKVTVTGDTGYNGVFMFPKTSVKTEAQLRQILSFFDKMGSADAENLVTWGVEGKHYTVEDGKAVPKDMTAFTNDVYNNLWNMEVFSDGKNALPAKDVPEYQKLINDNESFAVPDPTVSLISDTYLQKSQQLTQIITDAETKYIIGQLDDAGFQAAVDNWRKNGGDQVIQEFTDQYKKLHP